MEVSLAELISETEHARLLSVLANPKRLKLLRVMLEGEVRVHELADAIETSPSATSQHLSILRRENLVRFRRNAQTIYYSCSSNAVIRLLTALREIEQGV